MLYKINFRFNSLLHSYPFNFLHLCFYFITYIQCNLSFALRFLCVNQVFRCVSGECGRFYHPLCVSQLLHPGSEDEAQMLKERIANGASFTCPIHRCSVCNQGEIERDDQMRFAMCRRCPKSYHRKCLPRYSLICYSLFSLVSVDKFYSFNSIQ